MTHDYRDATRGWGRDIGYKPLPDNRLRAYGWGSRIQRGDFLLLTNGDADTRYVVEEIRYERDPPDQWFATLAFAPRGNPSG